MAETSKNKIYYNDNENSAADVLADMKKLAQSTDDAIEKSKYNDTQIKKDISNMKTEITAKDNEQDNKILQLQIEKAELEKELKEAQEDFYQNSIRGQASGEYIHVEDSSNCRAKIGIGGNQEQETSTQGRNLIIPQDYTETKGGITITSKNGVINVKGTSTSSVDVKVPINKIILKGDYYFSTKITGTVALNDCAIRLFDENKKDLTNKYFTFETNTQPGFSANMNGTTGYIYIYLNPATVDYYIYPQLEQGTQKNGYEQFVPNMPSPDYPSEVKAVGSNVNLIEETFKGYNLNGNGAFEVSSSFNMQIAKVKANVKYTLNTDTNLLGYYNEKPTIASVTYNKSRTVLSSLTNVIIPSKTGYIAIRTSNTEKVKIVEGTTTGEYSKSGQGCVKVTKCNKNLLGKYVTGIWIDVPNKLYLAISTVVGFIARVKPNTTYTIKKKNKGNRFLLTAGKEPVKIGNAFSRVIFASNHDLTQYQFTTKENEYYIFLGVYNGTDENELALAVEETQLECGNKATSYEEHQEQSYIMPTQAEMLEGDYFDWDNEEEVHTWNKMTLNGTEDWTYNSIENLFYIILENSDLSVSSNIHCTHFKSVLYNVVSNENNCITANGIMLILKKNDISNLEDYISYLKSQYDAGTPVIIYYKLQTPTRLKFIDEQKAVAKELNNARTYKNVTNITTDSIAILDLDYAKDLETLLNNTQALAVNNASEGV